MPGGPTSRMPRGICAPSRPNSSGRLRKSTISCSSAFASSTPATSSNVVLMPVSAVISLARLRPIENSPPPKPAAPAAAAAAHHRARRPQPDADEQQRRDDPGQQRAQRRCSTARCCTPRRAWPASPARSGGTCTVLNCVLPSGSFSVSVPRSRSPDTVTCFTFPASSNCWNWLYGMTAVPPLPPRRSRTRRTGHHEQSEKDQPDGGGQLRLRRWHRMSPRQAPPQCRRSARECNKPASTRFRPHRKRMTAGGSSRPVTQPLPAALLRRMRPCAPATAPHNGPADRRQEAG